MNGSSGNNRTPATGREARQLIIALELLRRTLTDTSASHLAAMRAGANPASHPAVTQGEAAKAAGASSGPTLANPEVAGGDPKKVIIVRDETKKAGSGGNRPIIGFSQDGQFVYGAAPIKGSNAGAMRDTGGRIDWDQQGKSGKGNAGERRGAGVADAFKGVGAMIVAGFGRVLSPMTGLASIITSVVSGFQVFIGAIRVFAATLAPLLLPVFVLLSTAIIAASDFIWDKLKPGLAAFYESIMGPGMAAVESFIDGIKSAAVAVMDFTHWIERRLFDLDVSSVETEEGGMERRQQAEKQGLKDFLDGKKDTGSSGGDFGPDSSGGDFGPGSGGTTGGMTGGKSSGQYAQGALKDVIKEMRMQQGPQAKFSGIAAASRDVQLAAINASPFEQKMLERMQFALDALEKVATNTNPKTEPRN